MNVNTEEENVTHVQSFQRHREREREKESEKESVREEVKKV